MKKIALGLAFALLFAQPSFAQFAPYPNGGINVGGGTVTSIATGCGLTATTITTTGTIAANEARNAQVGTSYSLLAGDCGKLVTASNAGAVGFTLLAPATAGSGYFADVVNLGVGNLTLTPAAGTINGGAAIVLYTGQGGRIQTDGSNYFISWAGVNIQNSQLANSSMTIASHSTALGGTVTIACADLSNAGTGCTTTVGTAAVANTGTSGHTIPFLDGNNAFSGTNTAPTQLPGDNSTKLATTAYVDATGAGSVSTVSVVSANGLAGTVATPTSTPAITLSTSITGLLKGNGTAISAASGGSDYVVPGGALGTPSSGTLTNVTGLPVAGLSNLGTGVGTWLVTPSGANLTSALTTPLSVGGGGTGLATLSSNVIYKGNGASAPATSALTDNGTIITASEPIDATTNSFVMEIANAGSTGTTVNKLAKLTGAPSTAVIVTAAATDGAVGIVVGGAGTTSNAQIAVSGLASCVFDGATTAGHYVGISASVNGDCTDAGASRPTGQQVIGIVQSTNGGGGTYAVALGLNYSSVAAPASYAYWDSANQGGTVKVAGEVSLAIGNANGGVRASVGKTSGSYYCEFALTGVPVDASPWLGLSDSSFTLGTNSPDASTHGIAVYLNTGNVYYAGANKGGFIASCCSPGDIIQFAFTVGSPTSWWIAKNGGIWNGNAGYSPGGTGAITYFTGTGSVYPTLFSYAASTGTYVGVGINCGQFPYIYSVPGGFSKLS